MVDRHFEHSDEALLSLILARHPDESDLLAILLQRHRQSLLTRCFLYLKNRQDAEDAAQETELRVFRAIHGFRRDSSFRTWLFTIADRQCHDLARRRARHVLGDHLRELIEIHEDSLRHTAENGEEHHLISEVLGLIPQRERDILVLRFYADLSLQEIANYLELGLSATKMRLYRALDLFGTRLRHAQKSVMNPGGVISQSGR